MLTKTVIAHWGGHAKAMMALGLSAKASQFWGPIVPPWIAFRAYWASNGELLIDPELYRDYIDHRVLLGRRTAEKRYGANRKVSSKAGT
jgi:hypothetical protein